MNILQVAAEAFPLVKTGGLADVVGALPKALAVQGLNARLLLPGFAAVRGDLIRAERIGLLQPTWSSPPLELWRGVLPAIDGVTAYVIQAPSLYERPGGVYADAAGVAWADNHRRFAPLAWAAAALARGLDAAWQPEVVHAHDWHAGLAPAAIALQARGPRPATVMTIHNLAYQGLFPAQTFLDLDLPPRAYAVDGLEFHGQLSFMKAGLYYADAVSTVSPTYAREVCTPEFGCGLDGLLRWRAGGVTGILNGVDEAQWSPATDPLIAQRYSASQMAGKAACKAALQRACGLREDPGAVLLGVVSRLTQQKGLDLLLQALPQWLAGAGPTQLVVLGSGDAELQAGFAEAAARHPGRVALSTGYDEALSHRIYAGADVMAVPSRFEPCGLTQLYALAYGALPLVRSTGGLADTVVDVSLEALEEDRATGFVFHRADVADLSSALRRAQVLWRQPERWRAVQHRGMAQRFGWDVAARAYAGLYAQALKARGEATGG